MINKWPSPPSSGNIRSKHQPQQQLYNNNTETTLRSCAAHFCTTSARFFICAQFFCAFSHFRFGSQALFTPFQHASPYFLPLALSVSLIRYSRFQSDTSTWLHTLISFPVSFFLPLFFMQCYYSLRFHFGFLFLFTNIFYLRSHPHVTIFSFYLFSYPLHSTSIYSLNLYFLTSDLSLFSFHLRFTFHCFLHK